MVEMSKNPDRNPKAQRLLHTPFSPSSVVKDLQIKRVRWQDRGDIAGGGFYTRV